LAPAAAAAPRNRSIFVSAARQPITDRLGGTRHQKYLVGAKALLERVKSLQQRLYRAADRLDRCMDTSTIRVSNRGTPENG
jgi:RNase adaptor protein for sRNA GlmZ degradation